MASDRSHSSWWSEFGETCPASEPYWDLLPCLLSNELTYTGHIALPAAPATVCPICAGLTRRDFEIHGYWVLACADCGHQCAELAPGPGHAQTVYSDAYFSDGGAGYPRYLDQARIVKATGRYYARLAARYMQPGAVLDIGAAAGFILKSFVDAGWRGSGIEPNASMAAFARSNLGLNVQTGTIEELTTSGPYNLVTMIQVLPHFWDLRRALDVAAGLTAPNGYWLIETWDRGSWTARILGKRWHEYSPPSVLHWFTRNGIASLATHHGFREVAHGWRLKWLLGKHAVSLLEYKLKGTAVGKVVTALSGLVPAQVPYPSEDLFWMLLKKESRS